MAERVPTDVVADDLVATYRSGINRLTALIESALRRGLDPYRAGTADQARGDATVAYLERQRAAAHAILRELDAAGGRHVPLAVQRAYSSAELAVDRLALGDVGGLEPRFGGIHQRAVAVLASNMARSLRVSVERAGGNVDRVFDRAAGLAGPLPTRGLPRARNFVGRRVDDPWRKVGLDETARGLVSLSTRRQVTAQMVDRLIREGVGDATTGFVDSAGRRWGLDRYAELVARTTTREATSRATANRMTEHGLDLVTISSHPHAADECTPYDGETFSLDGSTPGYDVLDELPPFHPNCVHVVTPANANLDAYEAELAAWATGRPDRG